MPTKRITRVNELLRREIAQSLYRVHGVSDLDLAAITITRVECSPDLRHAKVSVSVREDSQLNEKKVLHILNTAKHEIQQYVMKNVVLKYTPSLRLVLDHSISEGDRVLQLLDELKDKQSEDSDEG